MGEIIKLNQEAEGCLPLPKLSDEAVALLTAANSLLNSLALQGVQIPPRLLSDMTLFCREQTGFAIPFTQLAVMKVDIGNPANSIERQVSHVAMGAMNEMALVQQQVNMIRDGLQDSCTPLLEGLGMLDLRLERIYAYFGWSKMVVRAAARQALDRKPN